MHLYILSHGSYFRWNEETIINRSRWHQRTRAIHCKRAGERTEVRCDLAAGREASHGVLSLIDELEAILAAGFEIEMFFWVAGFSKRGHFSSLDTDTITRMVDINFRNPLTVAHWAWKKMLPTRSQSHFVIVSSTTGISTTPK